MKEIEDEKLREIMIKTISDWVYTVSGKSATPEELEEIKKIVNEIIIKKTNKKKRQK